MRIIQAEKRHVAPVWALIERCRAALVTQGILQWDDAYPTRVLVEADVRRGGLYVLEDAAQCVGCVTLDDAQEEAYRSVGWAGPEPALVVHRLCVDPAAQGQGRAHQLMDFVERRAVQGGYASVRLDAYSGNPRALGLYRRRGYREAGEVFFPRRALPFRCFELVLGPELAPAETVNQSR